MKINIRNLLFLASQTRKQSRKRCGTFRYNNKAPPSEHKQGTCRCGQKRIYSAQSSKLCKIAEEREIQS